MIAFARLAVLVGFTLLAAGPISQAATYHSDSEPGRGRPGQCETYEKVRSAPLSACGDASGRFVGLRLYHAVRKLLVLDGTIHAPGARLRGASFRNVSLKHAELVGADFTNAKFVNRVDLTGADLRDSTWKNASVNFDRLFPDLFATLRLDGADLRGADFSEFDPENHYPLGKGIALLGVSWKGARINAETRLPRLVTLDDAIELGMVLYDGSGRILRQKAVSAPCPAN